MKHKFKKGDELVLNNYQVRSLSAKLGATGVCEGYKTMWGEDFVIVKWDKKSDKWNGQNDGGYEESQFKRVKIINWEEEFKK